MPILRMTGTKRLTPPIVAMCVVCVCMCMSHQPRRALLDALPAHSLRVAPGHHLGDEVRVRAPAMSEACSI